MEKAITTILLTVASVVAMLVVVNATFPTVSRTSGSIVSAGAALDDRIKGDIQIVHAAGEVGSSTVYVWVKNVGASNLVAVNRTDLFFGTDASFGRVPYGGPGCDGECWEDQLENASRWEPTATLRITINLAEPLAAGQTYYVKVVLYNGLSDARYFSL